MSEPPLSSSHTGESPAVDNNRIYLITGANRGIGQALVKDLCMQGGTTVIACMRKHALDQQPFQRSVREDGLYKRINIALDEDDHSITSETLAKRIQAADPSIQHISVVIANAGSSVGFQSIADTDPEDLMSDFRVNAVGPMKLFKACWPLLRASPVTSGVLAPERKFVLITSSVGSIGSLDEEHFPSTAYGMSKAAANWFAKKLSKEYADDGLLVGIIHPGWVRTRMGQGLADAIDYGQEPPALPEDSAHGILNHVSELNNQNSGTFTTWKAGGALPW